MEVHMKKIVVKVAKKVLIHIAVKTAIKLLAV